MPCFSRRVIQQMEVKKPVANSLICGATFSYIYILEVRSDPALNKFKYLSADQVKNFIWNISLLYELGIQNLDINDTSLVIEEGQIKLSTYTTFLMRTPTVFPGVLQQILISTPKLYNLDQGLIQYIQSKYLADQAQMQPKLGQARANRLTNAADKENIKIYLIKKLHGKTSKEI